MSHEAINWPNAEIAEHFYDPGAEIVGRCRFEGPGDGFKPIERAMIGIVVNVLILHGEIPCCLLTATGMIQRK
ncbi:hypothetical protein HFO71_10355 [Rhizobium laguerreae]|uniref:hypothetical protein n=1 Tax=Rhizobium laguerreae TaxID=1076926 RepID=UPI001C92198E|nr:hypothetical protein [Rhizobium laguerreae]MBY3070742.1 hypothetical protein [Rhizobium laguerreae]